MKRGTGISLGVVATVVAIVGGSIAVWKDVRPFAYVEEVEAVDTKVRAVEQRACENELRAYNTEKRAITRDQAIANFDNNVQWQQNLAVQALQVEEDIERVKRECW